jgi:hypothetical protein
MRNGRCQIFDWHHPSGLGAVPTACRRSGRSLVLIGSEVYATALRAGFAVDVSVDVLFEVADKAGG